MLLGLLRLVASCITLSDSCINGNTSSAPPAFCTNSSNHTVPCTGCNTTSFDSCVSANCVCIAGTDVVGGYANTGCQDTARFVMTPMPACEWGAQASITFLGMIGGLRSLTMSYALVNLSDSDAVVTTTSAAAHDAEYIWSYYANLEPCPSTPCLRLTGTSVMSTLPAPADTYTQTSDVSPAATSLKIECCVLAAGCQRGAFIAAKHRGPVRVSVRHLQSQRTLQNVQA